MSYGLQVLRYSTDYTAKITGCTAAIETPLYSWIDVAFRRSIMVLFMLLFIPRDQMWAQQPQMS